MSVADILKAKRESQTREASGGVSTIAVQPTLTIVKDHPDRFPPVDDISRLAKPAVQAVPAPSRAASATPSQKEIISDLGAKISTLDQAHRDKLLQDFKNPKLSFAKRLEAQKKLQEMKRLDAEKKPAIEVRAEPEPEPAAVSQVVVDQLEALVRGIEENEAASTFSLSVKLNERQQMAADLAFAGKSFVVTGAAGTGKTTAVREIAKQLLKSGLLGLHDFKLRVKGEQTVRVNGPSIAFVAYTRRASSNMRNAIHKDPELQQELEHNIVTIHRLLEYQPVSFETEEGNQSMRFVPMRTEANPLKITHLVVDEASMVDTNLWDIVWRAMQEGVQIIFVGDINQLPPVMGKSILSYALVKLPVIELNEVYRQALDSDIIKGAHMILRGEANEFIKTARASALEKKELLLLTGKDQTSHTEETIIRPLAASFHKMYQAGGYDPDTDIILSPFNKNPLGTDSINSWISQFLGEKRQAMVYEIIAGRRKLYLAVGDKVMWEKRDGIVSKISINARYIGRIPQTAGTDLTRFGIRILGDKNAIHEDIDDIATGYELINVEDEQSLDEKRREASHIVEITFDDGEKEVLNAVGEFSDTAFTLGYALTVHKSQGCEWKRVFIVLHPNHSVMLMRELLYTAVTRAKSQCTIIAKEFVIKKAIENSRIKGNTLEEKIEFFNSGALDANLVRITK